MQLHAGPRQACSHPSPCPAPLRAPRRPLRATVRVRAGFWRLVHAAIERRGDSLAMTPEQQQQQQQTNPAFATLQHTGAGKRGKLSLLYPGGAPQCR